MSHHSNTDPAVMRRLGRIDKALSYIIERLDKMDLAPITAEVTKISDAVDSAVTLLQAIAQDIRDNITNQAKLAELATQLDTKAVALAEAVTANTPAAAPPTV